MASENMDEVSCIYLMKSLYHSFSEKERTIADFILANPREAVHPSGEELSEIIGISQSTLVRFVRKLGYSGYQRFRIALATETVDTASRLYEIPIGDGDNEVEVVFDSAIHTLEMTKQHLDRTALARAAAVLAKSRRILLLGTGGSAIVALDAFHKLIRTGLSCTTAEDYHMQLMLASQADAETAALIISHTGANMDTLAISEELKRAGGTQIIITSNPRSPLARSADILLSTKNPTTSLISEAFSARLAHLVVIDALYVELMKRFDSRGIDRLEAMRQVIAKRRT